MSLTASLNSALSGLSLASRRAEIIATNVANADTPGYASRRLEASGPIAGLPASKAGVVRGIDPVILSLRRESQSRLADASVAQSFHTRIETAIGDPDQSGSLQDMLARFDASLTTAAADPTSDLRLGNVARAAGNLVTKVGDLAQVITRERQSAEVRIGQTVDQLNLDLATVERLNGDIARSMATGSDLSNLLDQRQLAVDRISEAVPLRELPRERGGVALVSTGGVILLDGSAAKIGHNARPGIEPADRYPTELSGLTVRGRDIGPGTGLQGGLLGGLFALRDDLALTAMDRLDAFAGDLAARFEDPAVDPSLGAGEPGLFADAGAAVGVAPDAGLSLRLSLNTAVDADRGGDPVVLRAGLGVGATALASDPSQLLRYGAALAQARVPSSAALGSVPTGLADLGAALRSAMSSDRLRADDVFGAFSRQEADLVDQRDGARVDVDAEMRRLLEVEQAYAANARMIQVAGNMIDRLTEI
ncbi:FlgK family flagellar hook-associated protein [Jannaschia sp. M317]|uniref:FlgK family flagellar hook-associated protein n=1 Tax=Jannaschia sp. M317 TaxID=2867011 RepID=UPI0021A2AA03|nr:flagellar basal body protein [Jannaschia sp. M317]UWQ19004.1 flagellar hook-associated protein FlgK [Jannaschia sp. M317]